MSAPIGVHGAHRPPEECTTVRTRARKALRELVEEVEAQGGFSNQDRADAYSVLGTPRALTVEQLADALGHLRYDLLLSAAPRAGGEEIAPAEQPDEPTPSVTARATAKRALSRARQHLAEVLGIGDEERRGLSVESLATRAAAEIRRLQAAATVAAAEQPTVDSGDLDETFRHLLVQHRAREGLSRDALAKRCGLATTTIRNIELGHHSPKLATVQQIADALGVTAGDLLVSGPAASVESGAA